MIMDAETIRPKTAMHGGVTYNDARFSLRIFPAASLMHLDHLQKLVTTAMPYGKYKGRLLADLPGHYLGWFAREGFPKGELGSLIALMYELDHNALRHLLDPLRDPAGKNTLR